MNTADTPSRRSLFPMPPHLLRARTAWGIMVGAIASVIVCSAGALLGWQLGLYGRALSSVWTSNWEAAAWRGVLIGLLIGWQSRSFKQMLGVSGLGTVLLLAYEWKYQASQEIPLASLLDVSLMLHYALNTVSIGALTYLSLREHDRTDAQRHLSQQCSTAPTERDSS